MTTPKTKTPRAPTPLETALAEALRLLQTAATAREQDDAVRVFRKAVAPLIQHAAHQLARATREDLRDAHAYLEAELVVAAYRFDWGRGVYPAHYLREKVRQAAWAEERRAYKRGAREKLFPTGHSVFEGVRRRSR